MISGTDTDTKDKEIKLHKFAVLEKLQSPTL